MIKSLDKDRRLKFPNDLLKLVDFEISEEKTSSTEVAICCNEIGFFIRSMENVQDCKIIAVKKMDYKGRLIIGTDISKVKLFEIFVLNKELYFIEVSDDSQK